MEISLMTITMVGDTADGVKKKLAERGLKAGSYIYMDQFAAMDEAGFAGRVQKAKEAVDTAISFGTTVLMLVPRAQEGIESYTPEQIRGRMIRHFTPVVEYAKEKGVHVVVEDTPDLRLHICSADELKEVLEKVPGLEMVYDSGNMLLVGEDPVAYYHVFPEKIAHVHLKDMCMADPKAMFVDRTVDGRAMTGAPTGTGLVDLKGVVNSIKRHSYSGALTIEFAVDEEKDYRGTLVRSREYVEKLLAD